MLSKIILFAPFLLFVSLPPAQNRTPAPPISTAAAPPINMGLWEATTTTSSLTYKVRSCVTPQTYQESLTYLPPGCTLTNPVINSASLTGDVSCTLPNGATSTGHFNAEFPDLNTMHGTVNMTVTIQGRTMQTAIKTDSHFVSSSCGDIAPGESRQVK